MAMMEGVSDLTLELLNKATIAWVEFEYHRKIHSETNVTPLDRLLNGWECGTRMSRKQRVAASILHEGITQTAQV